MTETLKGGEGLAPGAMIPVAGDTEAGVAEIEHACCRRSLLRGNVFDRHRTSNFAVVETLDCLLRSSDEA